MGNIIYISKRLKSMDKKAMLEKINSIHAKTKMPRLKIFLDMQKCATRYGAGYMDYDLFEMYNLTDTKLLKEMGENARKLVLPNVEDKIYEEIKSTI